MTAVTQMTVQVETRAYSTAMARAQVDTDTLGLSSNFIELRSIIKLKRWRRADGDVAGDENWIVNNNAVQPAVPAALPSDDTERECVSCLCEYPVRRNRDYRRS